MSKQILVRRAANAVITDEYNCDFRRLYPWQDVVDTPLWGGAWAYVKPGGNTSLHSHDEHETFIVTAGTGEMTVDGNSQPVQAGDVIYLPPFSKHNIRNVSESEQLAVLCIWWGGAEADARMAEMVDSARNAKKSA